MPSKTRPPQARRSNPKVRLPYYKRFHRWWTGLIDREPGLFAHWNLTRAFDWNG